MADNQPAALFSDDEQDHADATGTVERNDSSATAILTPAQHPTLADDKDEDVGDGDGEVDHKKELVGSLPVFNVVPAGAVNLVPTEPQSSAPFPTGAVIADLAKDHTNVPPFSDAVPKHVEGPKRERERRFGVCVRKALMAMVQYCMFARWSIVLGEVPSISPNVAAAIERLRNESRSTFPDIDEALQTIPTSLFLSM